MDLEVDGNYISKLEYVIVLSLPTRRKKCLMLTVNRAALIHEGANGVMDPEKIGVVVAGIVAGEVLRE